MSTFLAHAQTLALTKLLLALEATDDPAEVRRLAQAILTINPDKFAEIAAAEPRAHPSPAATSRPQPSTPRPAAPSAAAASSRPQPPLTDDELAALQALLPHVKPDRFLRKHTPSHWREVLANHAHAPPQHSTTRAA
jgi:hypothetical protein